MRTFLGVAVTFLQIANCGLLGHSKLMGCSRYWKGFLVNKYEYQNVIIVAQIEQGKSFEVRYTPLLDIPYHDFTLDFVSLIPCTISFLELPKDIFILGRKWQIWVQCPFCHISPHCEFENFSFQILLAIRWVGVGCGLYLVKDPRTWWGQ